MMNESPPEPSPMLAFSSEPGLRQTMLARPPFDDPSAEIILRSQDKVDFRVHKLLLTISSDFFRDMFTLPQPSRTLSTDIIPPNHPSLFEPISVTESSRALTLMLQFLYPSEEPILETLDDIALLLEPMHKYHMAQERSVHRLLTSPNFLLQEPLRVYAIACRYKLVSEAQTAACSTLRYPILSSTPSRPSSDLRNISALDLQHLVNYRERAGIAAQKALLDFSWWKPGWIWFECPNASCMWAESGGYKIQERIGEGRICGVKAWFTKFLTQVGHTLRRQPSANGIAEIDLIDKAVPSTCPYCRVAAPTQWTVFVRDHLSKKLDRVLADIKLETDF